jgi:hypothetical protein
LRNSGIDVVTNLCSENHPCKTFLHIFSNIGTYLNPQICLFEGSFQIEPTVYVNDSNVVIIARSIDLGIYEDVSLLFYPTTYSVFKSLFYLEDGFLNIINLYLLHNNYSGGCFFNINGTGNLIITNCNIYGSQNADLPSICNYAFIRSNDNSSIEILNCVFGNITLQSESLISFIGEYGNISLLSCTFEYISSNGSNGLLICTPLDDSLSINSYYIMISNILVYNIKTMYERENSAKSYGGLISVFKTTESISILNSEFENVMIGGNTSGGIIYVGEGKSLLISNSTFNEIGTCLNGGVLYVESCDETVLIKSSYFENIISSGSGGAIYFGESTSFNVSSTTFIFCRTNGYGGAIAINSTMIGDRYFINDNFEENIATGGINKGNDFCDISLSSSTASLYNYSSVSGVTTLSQSPSFYINLLNISIDCLISGSCIQSVVYVSPSGNDVVFCGNLNFPCNSLDYSILNVLQNGGQVIINEGNYYKSNTQFSKNMIMIGNSNEISRYPVIIPNSSTNGTMFDGINRLYQFSFLKIIYSSSLIGNTIFSTCFLF